MKKVEALHRPLSMGSVHDGGIYAMPAVLMAQTNLFLKVGRLDELFIKVPSDRGWADYQRFVRLGESNPNDIRPLEDQERFARLELALETFPDLGGIVAIDPEIAHYLAVHKLQHERLRSQTSVSIPPARFAVLRSSRLRILHRFEPVMFQQRIRGATLWDMFDFALFQVRPRWRPFVPAISARLSGLLESGLRDHIDWNIQNFVFQEQEERLFYVDLKPTTFVARQSNERNLQGLRGYFLV